MFSVSALLVIYRNIQRNDVVAGTATAAFQYKMHQ